MEKIKSIFKNFGSKITNLWKKWLVIWRRFDNWFFNKFHAHGWIVILVLGVALSIGAKVVFLNHVSSDYTNFLLPWMKSYKEMGFWKGIGTALGDYTPFYNYFLCFFAQVVPEEGYLYAIKIFTMFFELIAAWGVFMILDYVFKSKNYAAVGASLMLILPSVIINGAIWGQCDVIFTSFVIWSFYFILRGKFNWAMVMFSLAFSIKLQAIFFLPFLFLLFLKRKIKIWQFLYIPVIYILTCLLACFAGRNMGEMLGIYFRQGGEYPAASLSAPSIFAFINNNDRNNNWAHYAGPIIFSVICIVYCFIFYRQNWKWTPKNLITLALLSLLMTPYLLPHMHERYFFVTDLFALIYLLIKKRGFIIALLINAASSICCVYFVMGENIFEGYANPIRVSAALNLIALGLLIFESCTKLELEEPKLKEIEGK